MEMIIQELESTCSGGRRNSPVAARVVFINTAVLMHNQEPPLDKHSSSLGDC